MAGQAHDTKAPPVPTSDTTPNHRRVLTTARRDLAGLNSLALGFRVDFFTWLRRKKPKKNKIFLHDYNKVDKVVSKSCQ